MNKQEQDGQQKSDEVPTKQMNFPTDLLILLMCHMDLRTLWHFMHSHRYAFRLVYDNTHFQRRYLARHITSSTLTASQILTLPSNYHARYMPVSGFGYHLMRAATLWNVLMPLNLNILQRIGNFLSPPKGKIGNSEVGTSLLLNRKAPDKHDWLHILCEIADENYDVILRQCLPSLDITSLPYSSPVTQLSLLNRAARRDHLECFTLLHGLIGDFTKLFRDDASFCFEHSGLNEYLWGVNPVNIALSHGTTIPGDVCLDMVINKEISDNQPDALINSLEELAILRLSPKSRVLQHLVDSVEWVEEELNYGTNYVGRAIASTLRAFSFSQIRSRTAPHSLLLTIQVIDLFRRHGRTIFRDESEFLKYQQRLCINAYLTGHGSSFPENFDLYLWDYVREIAISGGIDTNNDYWSNMEINLKVLTLNSLKEAQAKEPNDNRAKKIVILSNIIQSLWPQQVDGNDVNDAVQASTASIVTHPIVSFDTGPYIRRTVQTMIAERRQLMATRQKNREAHQTSILDNDNKPAKPPQ